MIIDFHTHCFPEALAPKALGKLSAAGGLRPVTDGTVAGTVRHAEESGVTLSVVCNIATNAHQMAKVNEFAIAVNDYTPSLTALGSVHPDASVAEIEHQLDHLLDHDIRGIKIHPEYAAYYVDEPAWEPIFAACEERGMFLLTHAGYDFISPDRIAVTPSRLAKVLDRHPELTVIAAHLGANMLWDEVKNTLCGRERLYFDTAILSREGADPHVVREIIRKHGAERILFGSDMPWSDPAEEIAFLRSLGLEKEEEDRIFFQNAEQLLYY